MGKIEVWEPFYSGIRYLNFMEVHNNQLFVEIMQAGVVRILVCRLASA